ncbi:T9SS type A sorting domain-containing protein [Flavobacterium jejuense]|uniref:T9SS type A sorting domain-containing protein n=1 Tax=Flavobacterium jejuense TaxID=1544455 RepID=A0ABX0IQE4_9FLAO|nr:glycosyl hydrolase [Flavobacterium jejuense]NHN25285.1 T9SS type A sorting domain-containing protein [Flavobacterium jejuense]
MHIKKIFSLLFIILISNNLSAQSPKRGIAYGHHSVADLVALSPGITWWYNWSIQPDNDVQSNYASIGVEFVPMAWNNSYDLNTFISNIRPGAKYLLAFNEPNFNDGARMTPQEAVNFWSRIETVAATKNLEIVSASPAFNGPNNYGGYSSPIAWHDDFFALCPNCKVDYIAGHAYTSQNNPYSVIGEIGLLKKYGKPIWVTEFANRVIQSSADKIAFMMTITNAFEADPDIYRYSWFTGRVPDTWTDMLEGQLLSPTNGVLSAIGNEYINVSYTLKKIDIPGRIIGNNHYRRKGTDLENTNDGGTIQNVTDINVNDWGEYMLNVPTAGNYNMTFRVATDAVLGKFDIMINDTLVRTEETFLNTGGQQNFTNKIVNNVFLPQGEVFLKIIYKSNDMNFNYIDVAPSNLNEADFNLKNNYLIYPNPFTNENGFTIDSKSSKKIKLSISDLLGRVKFITNDYYTNQDIKIGNNLSSGVYFLTIESENKKSSFKIIKK